MWRKRLSSPRCRSELIDSAWVVIVPGQKCIKKMPAGENLSMIGTQNDPIVKSRQTSLNSILLLITCDGNIRPV